MPKLSVFNHISVDGYFTDSEGDFRWAHRRDDAEWKEFVSENAQSGSPLLFGRRTYALMASFWPTPHAQALDPAMASHMNETPKYVFSRSLVEAHWNNTTILSGALESDVARLKGQPGQDLVILGSGSIVAQLSRAGLIDEYQFVITPIALGAGRTLFEGQAAPLPLRLTKTRHFQNGNILTCYAPN